MDGLNDAQLAAAEFGIAAHGPNECPPLLVIAGAGSGKTTTLAHRVARLIEGGADPSRILLLTFTRRAAAEMTRRAERIVASRAREQRSSRARATSSHRIQWAGTFHSVANRLLRLHSRHVGLDPSFTVLDQSDAADTIDLVRQELGLAERSHRFPRKSTCLSIYSHTVNSQEPLEDVLERSFPWCEDHAANLKRLFRAYVERKQTCNVLDYDDLVLYWFHLMGDPQLARSVRERFDHILVDEYQDTNALQAQTLLRMCPDGRGLSVVGDEAQSIYGFRAATVRNILDFPASFDPPAKVITLDRNYRSTEPILHACNAVIELAAERFPKDLHSGRASEEKPALVSVDDEAAQADYVVRRVLEHREAGIDLKKQAVLFRTAHHSATLEVELARRDIPFVKYGGLKFLEAAHVKDVLGVLRWAENPTDSLAAFRTMQILPGVGPGTARLLLERLERDRFDFSGALELPVPAAAAEHWPQLCELLTCLRSERTDWHAQMRMVRSWYQPHLERMHDTAQARDSDLEQLEEMSGGYVSRERFLTELTLDPPSATGAMAGPPHLDEDYLILSTIHSAKGQEWDAVFLLNVVDGCIPSDMATGRPEEIEEERRLLYVAMTRSRDHLDLVQPLRFFVHHQPKHGDRHVYAPRTRFLPDELLPLFERRCEGTEPGADAPATRAGTRVDVGERLLDMWR